MSELEENQVIQREPSKEFHLSTRIRRRPLSGKQSPSPSLSRSPSIPNLSRSHSGSRMAMSELLSRTSSFAGKISSYLPSLHSFSRNSSDSGVYSTITSRPPSTPVSRRSSIFSFGSEIGADTDSEDELLSHVNVVPGGDVNDAYDLKQLLGEGAFSKVYLAESKSQSGGLAAVKIIDKEELCKDEDKMFLVDKEIEIMSQLDHPNIVRLFEVYENKKEVGRNLISWAFTSSLHQFNNLTYYFPYFRFAL